MPRTSPRHRDFGARATRCKGPSACSGHGTCAVVEHGSFSKRVPGNAPRVTGQGLPPRIPRVAVVVPAFNAEAYIQDALASLQQQSEASWEAVVIDDGSTDRTATRAEAMARDDVRIRVVRVNNSGPGSARNQGLRLTHAPLVVFLDADDLLPPHKFASQADFLDSHPHIDIVYSGCQSFPEGAQQQVSEFPVETDVSLLVKHFLRGDWVSFPIHCAMVRRSAVAGVNGFRELRPLLEDRDLWTRLASHGNRFAFLPEPKALYRIRGDGRNSRTVEVAEGDIPILAFLARRPGDPSERAHARHRVRSRMLATASLLACDGQALRALRMTLASIRWARRPGEVLDSLRQVLSPGCPQSLSRRADADSPPPPRADDRQGSQSR
jgi:GT2 family glycosyltransferase